MVDGVGLTRVLSRTAMIRDRVPAISALSRPWCDACQTVRRKPKGGRRCPLCEEAVLSTEQLTEPNHLLYRHWRKVFRSIPGFSHCVSLRRVRCPNRVGDMDFLLVEPWPKPKLGLVEVEGWHCVRDTPMPLSKGLEQVTRYREAFRRYAGQGAIIRRESIDNAFDRGNQRGETNLSRWKSPARWRRALGNRARRDGLERLLSAASLTLVPILLSFRRPTVPNLTAAERAFIARTFSGRPRLYVGTVAWPAGDRPLGGEFV